MKAPHTHGTGERKSSHTLSTRRSRGLDMAYPCPERTNTDLCPGRKEHDVRRRERVREAVAVRVAHEHNVCVLREVLRLRESAQREAGGEACSVCGG